VRHRAVQIFVDRRQSKTTLKTKDINSLYKSLRLVLPEDQGLRPTGEPQSSEPRLIRLSAQEGRDVELILLR
jgi:hypothetical protein